MRFDPATGEERPYPSHAAQWREWHGHMAWLINPWTGERRRASDVSSDPEGLLIVPDGGPMTAAPQPVLSDVALNMVKRLVEYIESNALCAHESTHRAGAIWTVCDECGARWADDKGGKPEFQWPAVVVDARRLLAGGGQ